MGRSSGSYIVAANPRGPHRANQPSLMSSDSNETAETSTIGRSAAGLHGLHHLEKQAYFRGPFRKIIETKISFLIVCWWLWLLYAHIFHSLVSTKS